MSKRSVWVLGLAVMVSTTGCFRTRSDIAREKEVTQKQAQQAVAAEQATEQLEARMEKMQGRWEEQEHQRRQAVEKLEERLSAQDKKLSAMEEKLGGFGEKLDLLFDEIKKDREESASLARAAAEAVKKKENTGKKGTDLLNQGIGAFKKKKYSEAVAAFESYVEENPKGKHVIEANYFLGESLWTQKEYQRAILAFSVVHEKAPKTPRGRMATLRIAECFKALKKNDEAKSFVKLLVDSAPESEEAKKAKKLFK